MKNIENKIITTNPAEGEKLNIAGGEYRIIISGEQTNGLYAVIEMSVPPGAGPVPHAHPDFEESFFILEGEVFFRSENGDYTAKTGSYVSIPKGGIIHNFKNLSDKPAKLLCTVIPSGLDAFFKEVAGFIKDNATRSPLEIKENINHISGKYGQILYAPNYLDK